MTVPLQVSANVCTAEGAQEPGPQWSRKHAETQRYLCERFVRPVIGQLACQDIRTADMQAEP